MKIKEILEITKGNPFIISSDDPKSIYYNQEHLIIPVTNNTFTGINLKYQNEVDLLADFIGYLIFTWIVL